MARLQGQSVIGWIATALGFLLVVGLLTLPASGRKTVLVESEGHSSFSVEQRIACQITIEEIRWSHRIWPKENPTPKPPLSEVLSDAQILAKVEDTLRMETALETLYGVEITEAMLQAELNRIARSTKAPDRVQELFGALGNDPIFIAECLVRPQLVRRKLHNSYVWDSHHHGDLRIQAEAALAKPNSPGLLPESGGEEYLLVLVRKDDQTEPKPLAAESENGFQLVELDFDEFDREVARLTGDSGIPGDARSLVGSALRETENAFVYEEVLSQTENYLLVRNLVWKKWGFNARWKTQSSQWNSEFPRAVVSRLRLPPITAKDVASFPSFMPADSWAVHDIPTERFYHTAIWTGSEMIVWGGFDSLDYLSTGGRYDPVNDSWTATSTKDAASGRNGHTAIWTGREMIVWGGARGWFSQLSQYRWAL